MILTFQWWSFEFQRCPSNFMLFHFFSFNSQLSGHFSCFSHDVHMVLLENYLVHSGQPLRSGKSRWGFHLKWLHFFECGVPPLPQFSLPRMEKELYEREERAEMQQEILKKVARNLPVYTRTLDGGEATTKSFGSLVGGHVSIERQLQKWPHTCSQRDTSYLLSDHTGTEALAYDHQPATASTQSLCNVTVMKALSEKQQGGVMQNCDQQETVTLCSL